MRKELGSIDASVRRMDESQGFEIVLQAVADNDCDSRMQVGSGTCYSEALLRPGQLTGVAADVAAEHSVPELMDV